MIKIIVDTLEEKELLLKESECLNNNLTNKDKYNIICNLHLNPDSVILANDYKLIKVVEHNKNYLNEKIVIHHIT